MVSPLWKACSEGDLQNVQDLLNDATIVDIEIKGIAHVPFSLLFFPLKKQSRPIRHRLISSFWPVRSHWRYPSHRSSQEWPSRDRQSTFRQRYWCRPFSRLINSLAFQARIPQMRPAKADLSCTHQTPPFWSCSTSLKTKRWPTVFLLTNRSIHRSPAMAMTSVTHMDLPLPSCTRTIPASTLYLPHLMAWLTILGLHLHKIQGKILPRRVSTMATYPRQKWQGSSLVDTFPPVATEPPAFSHTHKHPIIKGLFLPQPNMPLLMTL